MTIDKAISENYRHGDLLQAIQSSIAELGKTPDNITIKDLAPVDEFHIGGPIATKNLIDQLGFSQHHKILDVGCGLGGAARFVANKYNCQVTGIDLTDEYIETGRALCTWVKLDKKVTLKQGSALAMSFEDDSFDGGYMLHVGMNIESKELLFKEIFRVLRPGSFFGVYDVMRIKEGELAYPVPWATHKSSSKLGTPDQYKHALTGAGLEVFNETNRRDFALDLFKKLRKKAKTSQGPPPLGLHTLLKGRTPASLKNMFENITADYIAPVEIIAQKL